MAKRTSVDDVIRELIKVGFITRKPTIIKVRPVTGKCKIKGCKGIVGKLHAVFLERVGSFDFLAYPCDKCGALHNSPKGEYLIKNKKGRPFVAEVFAHDIELRTRNRKGEDVYFKKLSQHVGEEI
jgi:hypothetical protein